jgi:hypothetical protein
MVIFSPVGRFLKYIKLFSFNVSRVLFLRLMDFSFDTSFKYFCYIYSNETIHLKMIELCKCMSWKVYLCGTVFETVNNLNCFLSFVLH